MDGRSCEGFARGRPRADRLLNPVAEAVVLVAVAHLGFLRRNRGPCGWCNLTSFGTLRGIQVTDGRRVLLHFVAVIVVGDLCDHFLMSSHAEVFLCYAAFRVIDVRVPRKLSLSSEKLYELLFSVLQKLQAPP